MSKFKVGDRVILNEHFDRVRTVGMKGVVTDACVDILYVTFDNGKKSNGLFDHRFILDLGAIGKSPTTIDVDTLGYQVRFVKGRFNIGCQTISFEDANKVADFIKSQVKAPEWSAKRGEKYILDDEKYIVAQVDTNQMSLIHMESGGRWCDPITVTNTLNMTVADTKKLFLSDYGGTTKVEKCK